MESGGIIALVVGVIVGVLTLVGLLFAVVPYFNKPKNTPEIIIIPEARIAQAVAHAVGEVPPTEFVTIDLSTHKPYTHNPYIKNSEGWLRKKSRKNMRRRRK